MEKFVCKHVQEGICRNARSPMCGKECPVEETPNVCKDEVLVRAECMQTPLGCMISACKKVVPTITHDIASKILAEFVKNMRENGYSVPPEMDVVPKTEENNGKYNVGDRVCYDDISDSDDWKFDSMSNHTEYPTVTYVTLDNTLTVSFENGSEYGTIMLNR